MEAVSVLARPHPAQYTGALLPVVVRMLAGARRILDPMAGKGQRLDGIRPLLPGAELYGIEIEDWGDQVPWVQPGSVLALPWPAGHFDAICVSPPYGNRMADHHNARDGSRRHTYRHALGRALHPDNAGGLQWGEAYRDFHRRAWREAVRVLEPGGRFVLNCKDHIRKGAVQPVTAWHIDTLAGLGLTVVRREEIKTPGQRHGAHAQRRVDFESVVLLKNKG